MFWVYWLKGVGVQCHGVTFNLGMPECFLFLHLRHISPITKPWYMDCCN